MIFKLRGIIQIVIFGEILETLHIFFIVMTVKIERKHKLFPNLQLHRVG